MRRSKIVILALGGVAALSLLPAASAFAGTEEDFRLRSSSQISVNNSGRFALQFFCGAEGVGILQPRCNLRVRSTTTPDGSRPSDPPNVAPPSLFCSNDTGPLAQYCEGNLSRSGNASARTSGGGGGDRSVSIANRRLSLPSGNSQRRFRLSARGRRILRREGLVRAWLTTAASVPGSTVETVEINRRVTFRARPSGPVRRPSRPDRPRHPIFTG